VIKERKQLKGNLDIRSGKLGLNKLLKNDACIFEKTSNEVIHIT
tara:strand:- start:609 stop:740 length:132 start_codon:yes stop_codon:yes gene_type:complete